jgi:hypothetical protein
MFERKSSAAPLGLKREWDIKKETSKFPLATKLAGVITADGNS